MIEVKEMISTKLIYDAVREERCRIARDLHDSVAQAMAGVVLHLETARIQFFRTMETSHGSSAQPGAHQYGRSQTHSW